jgi:hypothetical protein
MKDNMIIHTDVINTDEHLKKHSHNISFPRAIILIMSFRENGMVLDFPFIQEVLIEMNIKLI